MTFVKKKVSLTRCIVDHFIVFVVRFNLFYEVKDRQVLNRDIRQKIKN